MNIEKNFIIRFTTKKDQHFGRYFRKIVNSRTLYKYIGETNAFNALQTIKMFGGDKLKLRYRSYGRLEIWSK